MDCVQYLLDHGSNVHWKDNRGCIALHLAAENESEFTVDVMTILVKHKSNVHETDLWGRTPLDAAVNGNYYFGNYYFGVRQYLSEQGAIYLNSMFEQQFQLSESE